jgi:hypothetical protein
LPRGAIINATQAGNYLKPGSILLDSAGLPHITDFGLAKRVEGGVTLTPAIPTWLGNSQASLPIKTR